MRLLRTPRAFALICLLAASSGVSAQQPAPATVSGVVLDSASGVAIPAARVRLVEAHREETVHEEGTFDFTVSPGTYTLVVQRLGYRPHTRQVTLAPAGRLDLTVRLAPAPVVLAAAIITGTITERPVDEVLSPASVLTDAELSRRLEATLGETIRQQPGVAVTSIGTATARPVIRGLSGDRIVLLEDGLRPGDMSSFSGDHAVAIEPITAEQIEIVRGPMSLLYGSSALGGVINVVRDEVPRSLPDDLHGVVGASASSAIPGGAASASLTTGVGRVALRAEASGRGAGDTRVPSGSLPNTGLRTFGGSLGASRIGENGHFGGAYRFYGSNYGIPGGFVGGHPGGVDVEMLRHAGRLSFERHFSDAPITTLDITAQLSNYYHAEVEQTGEIGTEFGQDLAASDVLARHERFGPFSLGAFGLRTQFRDIRTGGSLNTPPTRDVAIGGFLVEEISRGAARFQLGLRYDWARYEPQRRTFVDVGGESVPVEPRTFGSVSGSAGVLYTVREGVRIGANVSRAFRTPDFNELYSNGPHLAANAFEVGDPRLRSETGLGSDVFVRVNVRRLRAEVAAFRNAMNGYVYPSSRGRVEQGTQGERPRLQYTNGDAVFTGFDGGLGFDLTQRWSLNGTFSSVFGRFTSDLDPIPIFNGQDTTFIPASRFPPLIPPVNGLVELRYDTPRFYGGGGARIAAAQERLGDFEERTSGHAVFDVDAGIRLLRGHRLQTVSLRVQNVFNQEYRDHLNRAKAVMPQPGRDVSLVYRLQF